MMHIMHWRTEYKNRNVAEILYLQMSKGVLLYLLIF